MRNDSTTTQTVRGLAEVLAPCGCEVSNRLTLLDNYSPFDTSGRTEYLRRYDLE
jgi:hypothetical protein